MQRNYTFLLESCQSKLSINGKYELNYSTFRMSALNFDNEKKAMKRKAALDCRVVAHIDLDCFYVQVTVA